LGEKHFFQLNYLNFKYSQTLIQPSAWDNPNVFSTKHGLGTKKVETICSL
jgi:hypothetical protein